MQYLLLLHVDEKAMQAATPEQTTATLAAYGAYVKAMTDAGVNKGGQRLRPTSTRRSRGRGDAPPRSTARSKSARSGRCKRAAARRDREIRDRTASGILPRIPDRRSQPAAADGGFRGDCRWPWR